MSRSPRYVRALLGLIFALTGVDGALSAQGAAQDHPGQYSAADIETGSRLYAGQCALCHGTNGETVAGVDLRRGQFRRAVSDEDIAAVIASGIPTAGMPGFRFQSSEVDGLVAFIRAGFDVSGTAVKVGHAGKGRAVFEGKGQCGTCHRVNGNGPRVAPDLSDIGAIRTPAALQRSLLDPTSAMLPINRPVRAVTRDGRTIRGRRLNEDTFTVQLIDEQEQLVSLNKADLRELEVAASSPMPSFAVTLTADEQADLLAYLLSMKGL
ncbi:MAG: c-type cytochrome [Luteitalea sp.]|nr:c-type cytochrome [Luteitalea sp.]